MQEKTYPVLTASASEPSGQRPRSPHPGGAAASPVGFAARRETPEAREDLPLAGLFRREARPLGHSPVIRPPSGPAAASPLTSQGADPWPPGALLLAMALWPTELPLGRSWGSLDDWWAV